jgi:hypothetical protein
VFIRTYSSVKNDRDQRFSDASKAGRHPCFSARLFRFLLSKCPFLWRKNSRLRFIAREKRLSPRRAPRLSLLPHSRRTQVRLKPLPSRPGWRQSYTEPTDVLRGKSTVCGLNGLRPTLRVGALHLNPRPRSALLLLRPLSVGRKAIASLSAKKYGTPYFSARKRTSKYPPKLLPKPR